MSKEADLAAVEKQRLVRRAAALAAPKEHRWRVMGDPTLGANLEQLRAIPSSLRSESDRLDGLSWSALADATGAGSDSLAAARTCAEPALLAVRSISGRFRSIADLLDRFATDVARLDGEIADEFDQLRAR